MPLWERLKPTLALGAAGAGALVWVLAFETGADSPEWGSDWVPSSSMRGKAVPIQVREVETTAEREKRLAVEAKELREQVGNMKKSILGDRRKMRGNEVRFEGPELPPDVEFNPREACQQMKLAYPERYGKIDCMAEKFDSPDPWWQSGP